MSAHDLILDRIRTHGPLTVADFMAIALYHPWAGYYSSVAHRTGRAGDFITSVDVGPLFGALLCQQFAEMWRMLRAADPATEHFDLVEAAAANGQLARDVLDAAETTDPEFYGAIQLHLVEASPAGRAMHVETLGRHAGKMTSSSATLPGAAHGVVFANELLDALPVHAVVMTSDGLRECYVDAQDSRLVERVGPLSNPGIERHLASIGARLAPGWRGEVNLAAVSWLTRARALLHRGFLVLIDYGHPAAELYSATHATGTLASYVSHVVEERRDPHTPPWLVQPGHRDITSHVDLTTVRTVVEGLGCRTLGILDQTYFLLALAGDVLGPPDATAAAWDTKTRMALKTLVMPGGLGSTHKVMIFGADVGEPALAGLSGPSRLT